MAVGFLKRILLYNINLLLEETKLLFLMPVYIIVSAGMVLMMMTVGPL
jgi:hypothetical protein